MVKPRSICSLLLTVGVCCAIVGFCLAVGIGVIAAAGSATATKAVAGAAGLEGGPKLRVMPVMANGQWTEAPIGARVASVVSSAPVAGDLVDSAGVVLEAGAGMPGGFMLNGVECWAGSLVRPGDSVDVVRGGDVVETIVEEVETQPQPIQFRGRGPFFVMRDPGRPAVVGVGRGLISGKVFGRTEKSAARPASVTRLRYRPQGKKVVLTLDDGPTDRYTSDILDLLKSEGVNAVFFMLGRNVATRPKLVKRIAAEGHELANHGYSHALSERSTQADIESEIERTSRVVKKAAGAATVWFRPPGGMVSPAVLQAAEDAGHRVVLWDVDSLDWLAARDGLGAGAIVENVLNPLPASGSVLLFHDGGGNRRLTVEALTTIIRRLKAEGYSFCTLSELAGSASIYGSPV